MAEAYKLKADASFPKALRTVDQLIDGQEIYEAVGVNYVKGTYLYENDLTPRDRERAANGDLDHLLEGVSKDEADSYFDTSEKGVFIPEHEAESVVLKEYGHEIVPRDQVLELKSAGAEAALSAQEDAKADGADERPNLKLAEFPSLADVSRGDENNVPKESEHVSEEKLAEAPSSSQRGVEQPPGQQVGVEKEAQEAPKAARRGRPAKKETTGVEQKKAAVQQKEADAKS